MDNNAIAILLRYIAIAIALFVIIFLLLFKERKNSLIFFGFFTITAVSPNLAYIVQSFEVLNNYPRLRFLPTGLFYFMTPLFYLYTKSLLEKVELKKALIYLIPGFVEFLFMFTLFCLPPQISYNFHKNYYWVFLIIHGILLNVYSLFFVFLTLKGLRNYHNKYLNFFSNTQKVNLNWIKNISYLLVFVFSFQLFSLFFEIKDKYNVIYLIDSIVTVILIYWISIYGIKQSHIPSEFQIFENYKPISDAKISDFEKIEEALTSSSMYKNPNLTVIELSKLVDLHPKKVSQAINQYSDKNFNHFVNKFRVDEAKKLLSDTKFDNLTIEAIFKEAGFNSKSVFNTVFKNETGETPSSFKKKVMN